MATCTLGEIYLYGELGLGTNSGPELCDGTVPCSTTPVLVQRLAGITSRSVAAGSSFSVDATSNGVYTWGYNGFGTLGIGSSSGPQMCGNTPCSPIPLVAIGLTSVDILTVSAEDGILAVGSDHKIYSWGSNEEGELGRPSTAINDTPTPTNLPSGVQVASASIGTNAGFALSYSAGGAAPQFELGTPPSPFMRGSHINMNS